MLQAYLWFIAHAIQPASIRYQAKQRSHCLRFLSGLIWATSLPGPTSLLTKRAERNLIIATYTMLHRGCYSTGPLHRGGGSSVWLAPQRSGAPTAAFARKQRRALHTAAACEDTSSSTSISAAATVSSSSRRVFGLAAAAAALSLTALPPAATAAVAAAAADIETVEAEAYAAYADRRFGEAVELLDSIAAPGDPRWLEMRAQVGG
jgi:hypothetical protein